jgi:hypothetical protein
MAVDSWDGCVSRVGVCGVCQTKLEPEQTYYATLFEGDDGYVRRDFCLACWKDELRDQAFSFWQSRIPAKSEKPKLFIDDDALKQIFRRLVQADDDKRRAFCFVLMLIMMRKRLLRFIETVHENNVEFWSVKLTGDETAYRVADPHLSEDQLEHVQEQLNEVLACDE